MGIWCPSTSSTRTPPLRKRVSSTRRKVSTWGSRRRPNSESRSRLDSSTVAAELKHARGCHPAGIAFLESLWVDDLLQKLLCHRTWATTSLLLPRYRGRSRLL